MASVRLFISVPSYRGWSPHFGSSVTGMIHHLDKHGLENAMLDAFTFMPMLQASCLSQARQKMLKIATENKFTHWLCLGDDMAYPNNFADLLLRHNLDIVAANYRRKHPGQIVGVGMDLNGNKLDSTNKTGIEEIASIGLDACMMRVDALNSVPKPHFEVLWCAEKEEYYDLDVGFCHKVRKHGLKIWCDHDASQAVHHFGEVPYTWPQKLKLAEAAE